MTDLDLALRTPGNVMLLEPGRASALIERGLTMQRPNRGLLASALGLVGIAPRADREEERPDTLAMPAIRWAGATEFGEGYAIVDGVAVFDVEGVMTPDGYYDWWEERWIGGYAQIGAAFEAAQADDRVRGLFGRFNTPGGLVDGCFDLADVMRAANGSNGGKPFWAHARMACSAGYALIATADRVLASAEADVGSIGVVVTLTDISGWLAEVGIKVEAIQSGLRKTDGASWKPLSDEARAHLQAVVDQIARRFVSAVEAGRPLSSEQIKAMEAAWFLAQHDDAAQSGLALGLVDEIATERAAFATFLNSLSDTSGSGAPAGTGTLAAKPAARTTQKEETEMSLADQIAALRAKAARGDKSALRQLKALGVSLKAEKNDDAAETDDDAAEGGDEDEEAEGEDEDTSAEGGDDEEEAEGDDDKEPNAKAKGARAGEALIGCKQAKGREALAGKLAAKVGAGAMTYGEAKGLLAVSPRGSRLADAMADRDHNPGQDRAGSGKAGAGLAAAVDRFNAKRAGK